MNEPDKKIFENLSLIKCRLDQVKSQCIEFCKNKNVSLSERWKLFVDCELGEINNTIFQFSNIYVKHQFLYSEYFNSEGTYGKGSIIDLVIFLNNLEKVIENPTYYPISIALGCKREICKLDIEEAKEELMKQNIRACYVTE